MRYRPLSPTGDYTIGQPWYVNNTNAVAQAIKTRLNLWLAEWFIDTSDGTPWLTQVFGPRASRNPDAAIRQRILQTPGVTGLVSYQSTYFGATRQIQVQAQVQTQYSTTPVPIDLMLTSPTV